MAGRSNGPPIKLKVWRVLHAHRENGPMHMDEIAERLPEVDRRTLVATLKELAEGRPPALQVQRVMRAVYQTIPD